jgi:hypothetical protein
MEGNLIFSVRGNFFQTIPSKLIVFHSFLLSYSMVRVHHPFFLFFDLFKTGRSPSYAYNALTPHFVTALLITHDNYVFIRRFFYV